MGNATSTGAAGPTSNYSAIRNGPTIDSYVGELPELTYEKSLGSARFMKTIRCKHKDGPLVVKIFIKPDSSVSLQSVVKKLIAERDILQNVSNAFPYQRIIETEKAGYMIRQHLYSNLYDRISTRPFLAMIEKKWIAFQILSGLMEAHAHQICHGDIKTENILVTSWNWAYLSDFSTYKPTYLPEDNPTDFSFFFDTSSRRTCYLAPERFLAPGENLFAEKGSDVTPEMDIFALGCTFAELFREGSSIFSFSQLLRYRRREYDPTPELAKIEDEGVREMIQTMILVDPSKRGTAAFHWNICRGKVFPELFYTFLHDYVSNISELSGSTAYASQIGSGSASGNVNISPNCDARLEKLHAEFRQISVALSLPQNIYKSIHDAENEGIDSQEQKKTAVLPLCLSIPGYSGLIVNVQRDPKCEDGSLILVSIVCSSIRHAYYPSSRMMGIELLLVLGMQLSDDHRLDRVVPYIMSLLNDENASVRMFALCALTQFLELVDSISIGDISIFPEYILPSLHKFGSDPDVLVRIAYAQCIATIAETALRFIELSQILKSNIPSNAVVENTNFQRSYDTCLSELHDMIQDEVVALISDSNPQVKRALIYDMPRLCIFFGRKRANDVLLGHIITYLNDQDWQLRRAFFECVVGVSTFVGARSLEEYIFPLMAQASTDPEDFVVEKVLSSMASLAELGLLQKAKLKEFAVTAVPLLCHPNIWIRGGTIGFIAATAKCLPRIDIQCYLYPTIKPFLKADIPEITEILLLENLKPAVSQLLYDQTMEHAGKSKDQPRGEMLDLGLDTDKKERENNDLLRRLKELGMTEEDKEKLFSLKYFIVKSMQGRLRKSTLAALETGLDGLDIKSQVTPHTVFLTPPSYPQLTAETNRGRPPPSHLSFSLSQDSLLRPSLRIPLKESSDSGSNLGISPLTSDQHLRPDRPYLLLHSESDPKPQLPPQSPDSAVGVGLPIPGSRANRPLSMVSNDQISETESVGGPGVASVDRASLFSLELVSESGRSARFGVSPATLALSNETATATMEQRVTASSVTGIGSRSLGPRGTGSIAAAVVAAAAVGSQRSGRSTPIRRDSEVNLSTHAGSPERPSVLRRNKGVFRSSELQADAKPANPPHSQASSIVGLATLGVEARDRYVRRLLETKTVELFPTPLTELGPKVNPPIITSSAAPRNRRRKPTGSGIGNDLRSWRPDGVLAAHLTEHSGSVNQIKLSPDHNFFVSCSNDGTYKIWDTQRLERNVTSRSRLTYSQQGGKIVSVAFCENTHSVVSASDNGTIHVARVEYISPMNPNGSAKYGNVHNVRFMDVDDRDWPVLVDHYETELDSILCYATAQGKFRGLDMRTMKPAWSFDSPPQYGVISAFVTDKRHTWALTGTTRGVFTLWDLRFGLKVKSWAHPSRSTVHRIVAGAGGMNRNMHDAGAGVGGSSSTKVVMAAVGRRTSEVSLWDMETGDCQEVWCAFGETGLKRSGLVGGVDPADEMNRLYGNGLKALRPPSINDFLTLSPPQIGSTPSDSSTRSFVAPADAPFLLTAGADRKIRFWDLNNVESSYVVNGLDPNDMAPRYSTHRYGDVNFNIEYTPALGTSVLSNSSPPQGRGGLSSGATTPGDSASLGATTGLVTNTSAINHMDAINDIVITQVPYPMAIAGGRDGVVKVWI